MTYGGATWHCYILLIWVFAAFTRVSNIKGNSVKFREIEETFYTTCDYWELDDDEENSS
jgi:hypothetical protein